MRLRAAALLSVCGCLILGSTPAAARREPVGGAVPVAVADFYVTGFGEPRFWLGPIYAEVLARRLLLCPAVLLTEPIEARAHAPTIGLQDVEAVKQHLFRLAAELEVPYVIGGLIEDKGETLVVHAVAVSAERESGQALQQEVPFEQVFQPQMDIVMRRFMPNMGVRVAPPDAERMAAYRPSETTAQLQQIGEGWRAYAPDDPGRSLRLWSQVLAEQPESRLAGDAVALVSHLYRRYLYDRAVAYYERMANVEEPDNPLAHYHLAELYGDHGRWVEAERQYERAITLRSSFFDAYLGLGRARLEQGFTERAILAFKGGLAISPENPRAMLNLGAALYRRGKIPEALEIWNRILTIDPDNELARKYLATYGRSPVEGAP